MGLAFRFAVGVGIGFLGVLSVFGCAATAPPSVHPATSPPIAVPQARAFQSGADTEVDPDCPYLTVGVRTPMIGKNVDERRAAYEIQRPYIEKFLAHLKRVGFKAQEPVVTRLKREGFTELGTLLASAWGEGDRTFRVLTEREQAEFDKIQAKLTRHDEARLEQILADSVRWRPTWIVMSQVMDIAGSELFDLPKGDRMLAWSWSMEKKATVLGGALRVDLFTDPEKDDPNYRFGSIGNLGPTWESNFGITAAAAADWAAAIFLPHAMQLCADMNATLLEEEAKLERIRDQLTEEILRVRERRAEHEKQLKLEVE